MLKIEDIKALNIEMSSKCIGNCPFCSRSQKVREYGEHDISLADFQRLPQRLLKHLERMTFAGNFGDFCSNPAFPDVVAYIREVNADIIMEGDTNGSVQNVDWWQRLGSLFGGGDMIFALDGLQDTHRIHRRGTDFKKILKNIEAFISAGGRAYWKFIVFEHNQHQIEAAEKLAQEMGFAGFMLMASRDYDENRRIPTNMDVPIKRELYYGNLKQLGKAERYALCKPFHSGSIYIAADGSIHPCCFAHCMYITSHHRWFDFIGPLIEKYGTEINFKHRDIADILAGPYFRAVQAKSRTNRYCLMKCNRNKNKIRKKLVLYKTTFDN
jgi:MoaA/NifB/PqqE/SkfB family radical SAM enzyme